MLRHAEESWCWVKVRESIKSVEANIGRRIWSGAFWVGVHSESRVVLPVLRHGGQVSRSKKTYELNNSFICFYLVV